MNYWEGAREIERENGRQNKTQHNTKAAETPTDTHRLSAQIWKSKSETTEMAAPALGDRPDPFGAGEDTNTSCLKGVR